MYYTVMTVKPKKQKRLAQPFVIDPRIPNLGLAREGWGNPREES